ncbi:polyprenyl synthetase family protein [Kitasatospora sp. NPDC088160]|uniref:polyprenyl synthetase family protein n=1 Tax=Kitasatospora sp. NPDC088160 TaxID=3364072 RepID=UPI0038207B77
MSDEPRDCERILAHSADTVRPLIRTQVNRLPAHIRHLAGLHFGWWTDDRVHLDHPTDGKALRPALTLLACRAVGGDPAAARPGAVAVELVHNASLLHDDIIDHDRMRRHRPALWAAKGIPAAILAGDALFFAAVRALAEAPRAEQTIPVLLESVQLLIEGEYLDILLETGTDVSEDRALAVAAGKTGELFAAACALGAIAGGADPQRAAHLRAFGRHLGIAFQCIDDLLGIWGDEQATGKPALSDLRRRKVSLPVAAAMAGHTPQAEALRGLYRQSTPPGDEECRHAAKLIEQTGARDWTLYRARRHSADAHEHLALARPTPAAAAELATLAEMISRRDH